MRRRAFLSILSAAAWPLAARAQLAERVRKVGVLMGIAAEDTDARARSELFERTLEELGWSRGRNLLLEYRWIPGGGEAMRAAAKELVASGCDVILARSTPAARALVRETRTIPVVAGGIFDPVGNGFAHSLARPGGNVTGITNYEPSLAGKWLELLKSVAPNVSRVALLSNPDAAASFGGSFEKLVHAAAPSFSLQTVAAPVRSALEIETVIEQLARDAVGLIIIPDVFMSAHRVEIARHIAKHRLPAIYPNRVYVESGGLVSYSIDTRDLTVRSAAYVDRILRGANPAELPIEQPTKYELVVNMRTARQAGIEIPALLLAAPTR